MNSSNRITAKIWRDQAMPYVETRQATLSDVSYQSHSHPTFSIGAVDEGESFFYSEMDTRRYRLTPGTLVLIPAQLDHCCNPLPDQAWSYHMMHLDQQWLDQLHLEHTQFMQKYQSSQYPMLSQHLPCLKAQVIYEPVLYQNFIQLNQVLFDSSIRVIEKQHALLECLSLLLLPPMQWQRFKHDFKQITRLNQCVEMIAASDEFVSLEDLSAQVGLSRYALIRLFKQSFGFTPHVFQLNLRIQQGCELLKHGVSIAEAAHRLGFCDQSHFHRVFKKMSAITPLQYQQTPIQVQK